MIDPFINFKANANIEAFYAAIELDLALASFSFLFDNISNNPEEFIDLSLNETILRLTKMNESGENFKELITVLSRIAACTPHSADLQVYIEKLDDMNFFTRFRLQKSTVCRVLEMIRPAIAYDDDR